MVLIYISLVICDVEHLFTYLLSLLILCLFPPLLKVDY